jgi:putative membrane protein
VLAGVSLGACSSGNKTNTDSANGTAATGSAATSTATPATDSAGYAAGKTTGTTPTGAMADSGAAASASPANMSDAQILAKADAGDSAEVAIAKYMRANSTNGGVKAYASLLDTDHGKGISKVEGTAKKLSLAMQLPAGDTTAQETSHVLDHLKSLNGNDRDTAFVNHEIADHQQDIADAKQMAAAAKNPEVKSLIQKELPELQDHLDRAQKLSTKLGGQKK